MQVSMVSKFKFQAKFVVNLYNSNTKQFEAISYTGFYNIHGPNLNKGK